MNKRIHQMGALAIAVALCFVAAFFIFQQDKRTYRIGYANFPPYIISTNDAIPKGFAVEVMQEAARRAKISLQWVPVPTGPAQGFANHTIDLYPLLAQTPDRVGKLHLSQPWWENSLALIVDQRRHLDTPDALIHQRIATVNSSISSTMARQLFPQSSFVGKTLYEDVLGTVCSGEADAAFLAIHLYEDLLQKHVKTCELTPFKVIFAPEATILYSVGSQPEYGSAANRLAVEVGNLAFDGTMARIGARTGVLVTSEAKMFRRLVSVRRTTIFLLFLIALLFSVIVLVVWQNYRVRQARKAAVRAREAETEFLAHMSHEIRTPMNGVLGMLSLALDTRLSAEQRDYLDTANHSAIALMSVLNDILDFSKIDAGKMELEQLEFSPRELAEECLKTLSPFATKKSLQVSLDVAPSVPMNCIGDANRLRQVLLNLIGNAVKFTAEGSVTLKIDTEAVGESSLNLHFQVKDTGIGISPEQHASIFEAFSQADRSTTRRFGGTGLGLAISSRLVQLMAGRIWVESVAGQGSTFHFTAVFGRTGGTVLAAAMNRAQLTS